MFCPKCGQQSPDGSQFCHNCGAPLGGPSQAAQQASSAQSNATAYAATSMNYAKPRKKTNLKLIIGAALGVVALVALIVFLIVPMLGGGKTMAMNTLVNGDSKSQEAELNKMVEQKIDGVPVYFSSEKMAEYCEDLYDDLSNGKYRSLEELTSALGKDANTLNGEWVLVNLSKNGNPSKDPTGIVLYATIVKGSTLNSEGLAKMVDRLGVDYQHVIAGTTDLEMVTDILRTSGYSSSSIRQYIPKDAQTYSTAVFYNKSSVGAAVAIQFDDYAVVLVLDASAEALGIDEYFNDKYLNDVYIR